jgi:opacity protein-like surface antigen
VGALVFGGELDAAWADLEGTNTCFAGTLIGFNCGAKVKALGTIAGRLGYAVDQTLLYVKGGGAWVQDEYSLNFFGLISTANVNKWGWTIGGGIEHALTRNWTIKLEYNYMDFGSNNATFIFQPPLNTFSIDQRVHVAKLGVNYLFNFAPAVVTK